MQRLPWRPGQLGRTASANRHCCLQPARQTPYMMLDTAYLSLTLSVSYSLCISFSMYLCLYLCLCVCLSLTHTLSHTERRRDRDSQNGTVRRDEEVQGQVIGERDRERRRGRGRDGRRGEYIQQWAIVHHKI